MHQSTLTHLQKLGQSIQMRPSPRSPGLIDTQSTATLPQLSHSPVFSELTRRDNMPPRTGRAAVEVAPDDYSMHNGQQNTTFLMELVSKSKWWSTPNQQQLIAMHKRSGARVLSHRVSVLMSMQ